MEEKKILIADDHLDQLMLLRDIILPTYGIEDWGNGIDVFNYIKECGISSFDGAVFDYRMTPEDMPRMRGFDQPYTTFQGDELAITLRKEGFQGPIILRSSMADLLENKLNPYDVLCVQKNHQDYKILPYLQERLD